MGGRRRSCLHRCAALFPRRTFRMSMGNEEYLPSMTNIAPGGYSAKGCGWSRSHMKGGVGGSWFTHKSGEVTSLPLPCVKRRRRPRTHANLDGVYGAKPQGLERGLGFQGFQDFQGLEGLPRRFGAFVHPWQMVAWCRCGRSLRSPYTVYQ